MDILTIHVLRAMSPEIQKPRRTQAEIPTTQTGTACIMRVNTLIEFIDASIDTRFVSSPFEERGGIMIVGFPGTFKSTIIRAALDSHADALTLSDLNVHQWLKLREDFITGRYTCMGFLDFEKIYQRHMSTSSHIEGIIKGLVSEGYGVGPSGDQRMPSPLARALVVGGVTADCMQRKFEDWRANGFLRRFIWPVITIENINEISAAIKRWQKIDFGKVLKVSIKPGSLTIPMDFSSNMENQMEHMMREQPGYNGPGYILLKKICAVLLWKHTINGSVNKVKDILDELQPALSRKGGKIVL